MRCSHSLSCKRRISFSQAHGPVPYPEHDHFPFLHTGCLICRDQAAVLTSFTYLANFTAFRGSFWMWSSSPLQGWLLWASTERFIHSFPAPPQPGQHHGSSRFISLHCLLKRPDVSLYLKSRVRGGNFYPWVLSKRWTVSAYTQMFVPSLLRVKINFKPLQDPGSDKHSPFVCFT